LLPSFATRLPITWTISSSRGANSVCVSSSALCYIALVLVSVPNPR
jgi:hypothetical protein